MGPGISHLVLTESLRRGDWKLPASDNPSDGFTWISFPLTPPEAQIGNLPSFFFTVLSRQAVTSALGLSLPSPAFPCYLRHAPEEVFLNANPIMSLSCLKITGATSLPAPVMGKIGPRLNVVLAPPKKLESKSQQINSFQVT